MPFPLSQQQTKAENAEEQAEEASDALSTAKQEIKRLRAVLGNSNLAGALEQSELKVLSPSCVEDPQRGGWSVRTVVKPTEVTTKTLRSMTSGG